MFPSPKDEGCFQKLKAFHEQQRIDGGFVKYTSNIHPDRGIIVS